MKEKKDKLADVISTLEKKYGSGVVLRKNDKTNIESIPTGCYAIDNLIGCGGLPRGRMIEIYGQESSGKTTLCLFFAAQIQKQGGKVAFLDIEQSYDQRYAESIGVDTDKMIVSQPSTLEETFDILRLLVKSGQIDLIILDSVAAMVPQKELEEGALEKDSVAIKARSMSKYLPVVVKEIAETKTVVIFINQLRDNVGVYYGPKDTTPGGKALKFFSSVRLAVKREEAIKDKDQQIGNYIRVTAKKNKVGFPFRECRLAVYYGKGIDLVKDSFDAAVEKSIISVEGRTYSFDGIKLGTSYNAALETVRKDKKLFEKIYQKLSK